MFHLKLVVGVGGRTSWMRSAASRPAVCLGALLRFAEGRWRGVGAQAFRVQRYEMAH